MLKELGQSFATRPFQLDRLSTASAAIERHYGKGCLIEACACAGVLEATTMCADSTGKAQFPTWMLTMMYYVMSGIRLILDLFRKNKRVLK